MIRFSVSAPKQLSYRGSKLSRAEWLDRLWADLSGLAGIDEGQVLSEGAFEQGFETESWTVDTAEAPRERDWVGSQDVAQIQLYFGTQVEAEAAHGFLAAAGISVGPVEDIPEQDWNATWKQEFLKDKETASPCRRFGE